MRRSRTAAVGLGIAALAGLAACGPGDPRAEVLRQRSRWTIELLNWVPKDDGTISLTLRVTGPPNSKLDQLTFRISQLDGTDAVLDETWRTIDLEKVPRGAPKDLLFAVPSAGEAVQGLAADLVLQPTPEEASQIGELQGL